MRADSERDRTHPDATTIPLGEERIVVGKREVERGRVRVQTITDSIAETVRQELSGMAVDVSRVAVDRLLDPGEAPPQVRTEGDVTIVPVIEEILIVEKRLRVVEELRISRRETREVVEIALSVRRQRAVIERIPADPRRADMNADTGADSSHPPTSPSQKDRPQ